MVVRIRGKLYPSVTKPRPKVKILPGMYDILEREKVTVNHIREVQVEDLLGRGEPVKVDLRRYIRF